jgi:hypothetical protein
MAKVHLHPHQAVTNPGDYSTRCGELILPLYPHTAAGYGGLDQTVTRGLHTNPQFPLPPPESGLQLVCTLAGHTERPDIFYPTFELLEQSRNIAPIAIRTLEPTFLRASVVTGCEGVAAGIALTSQRSVFHFIASFIRTPKARIGKEKSSKVWPNAT